MINQLYTLRALSPLHCGVGQGANDIDLPTARNKLSGHPLVPASSLKGVLKDGFKNKNSAEKWQDDCTALFGGDTGSEHASAISIGDANMLALTVRSYFGTYAYLASPYTLLQIKTLYSRIQQPILLSIPPMGIDQDTQSYKVRVCKDSLLTQNERDWVLLEELDLSIDSDDADSWADFLAPMFFADAEGQKIFKTRFAIVDDNALNFLCDTSLPVDARIAIDEDTGTVKKGALWYEETVPIESLFVGHIAINRSYFSKVKKTDEQLSQFLIEQSNITCQVGGKSTTGKGAVEISFVELGASDD